MSAAEGRERRCGPWLAAAAVGVLAVAGVAAWQMWPSGEPDVAVPARVCEGALPGTEVKALLPEKGKQFSQWHTGVFNPEEPYTRAAPGTCKVYGGGRAVRIEHLLYSGSDYTMKDVARDAGAAGATPIALGAAAGFHKGDTTSLFIDCSSDQGKAVVEVDVTYRKTSDRAVIRTMASLAADTLRLEARGLWDCDGAERLPNGSPRVG
ncbi:hypothetical protein GCM10010503_68580 [Streptomyces lucensis JCM 4490]|uniref:Uncharacterized protein n=1 Tax=Streptomyces lucensis JCM 4490 TaxID=1306176 RepID=A0A918MWP8_9ACTN|nr:hypothetical protein [Streptomyces lucensis]GGW81493.1 hypothetical protein GCM10010503_68580 [Streptomyces lucensis JCM 4490]